MAISAVRPSRLRLRRPNAEALIWLLTGTLLLTGSLVPDSNADMVRNVGWGILKILPVLAIASLLAGALTLGNWSDRALSWLKGGTLRSILIASLIGAVTPVCGLGVLPLIASLLRRGVPLAPIMAFWVSSPVTDPSMMLVTGGIIGPDFAIAKTVAAFSIGLFAGVVTAGLPGFRGSVNELMRTEALEQYGSCEADRSHFWPEVMSNTRLALRWLALALVLEVFLQRLVPDEWIMSLFGNETGASVPLAVIVGAPMYLDGYASLPLVRGLLEMGMSFGAALALMVSGAAISLYAAVAVVSVVRARVFALYVILALLGACLVGYAANLIVQAL